MSQRKILVLAAIVAIAGLVPAVAYAHDGEDHGSTLQKVTDRVKTAVGDNVQRIIEPKREQIQEHTDKLREQVKIQRDEVKTKLEGERKDKCAERQAKINTIVNKSTANSKKHLGTFQKIEQRVEQFVTDKHLTVENYDALVANIDAKEAAAIAAVDVASETVFSCDSADATNPGSVIKNLMQSQHNALKDYRAALKDLITAVKSAASQGGQNNAQ